MAVPDFQVAAFCTTTLALVVRLANFSAFIPHDEYVIYFRKLYKKYKSEPEAEHAGALNLHCTH